jgi:hypothetical protein
MRGALGLSRNMKQTLRAGSYGSFGRVRSEEKGERMDQNGWKKVIAISYLKVHSKEREPSSSINDASSIGYLFLI